MVWKINERLDEKKIYLYVMTDEFLYYIIVAENAYIKTQDAS